MKDKIIPTNTFSSYNNTGVMTEIGRTNKDFSGHELNVAMRLLFGRCSSFATASQLQMRFIANHGSLD